MADCNRNFSGNNDSYSNKITLASDKEEQLRKSRDGLRERIKKHLSGKKVKGVKFYRQGSYAHRTLINPLDGDYDIDDGLYMDLSGFEDEPTTATIHNWVKEAVKGHTKKNPIDKEACVRAVFQAGYHVDIPAYKYEKDDNGNETYYLAKITKGWEESNPRAMTDWFLDQVKTNSEQIRRMVRYFKGWRDYRNTIISSKLPNGLTLTILACEEYQSDIRDDISFLETARTIWERLKKNDSIWKPYKPTQNMRDILSDAQFNKLLEELEHIRKIGDEAIEEESPEKAAKKWQKIFGDRFPVYKDSPKNAKTEGKSFATPAIVGTTVRSA